MSFAADSLQRAERQERLNRALAIAAERRHLPGYALMLNLPTLTLVQRSLEVAEFTARRFGSSDADMAGLRSVQRELAELAERAIEDMLSLGPESA